MRRMYSEKQIEGMIEEQTSKIPNVEDAESGTIVDVLGLDSDGGLVKGTIESGYKGATLTLSNCPTYMCQGILVDGTTFQMVGASEQTKTQNNVLVIKSLVVAQSSAVVGTYLIANLDDDKTPIFENTGMAITDNVQYGIIPFGNITIQSV